MGRWNLFVALKAHRWVHWHMCFQKQALRDLTFFFWFLIRQRWAYEPKLDLAGQENRPGARLDGKPPNFVAQNWNWPLDGLDESKDSTGVITVSVCFWIFGPVGGFETILKHVPNSLNVVLKIGDVLASNKYCQTDSYRLRFIVHG